MPVLRDSQPVYCFASFQEREITGILPRPQPWSKGFQLQPPSRTQVSHSSNVTSNLPTAKGRAMLTSCCCGPSSRSRPASDTGEPIRKMPGGITTISGQFAQSRNTVPCGPNGKTGGVTHAPFCSTCDAVHDGTTTGGTPAGIGILTTSAGPPLTAYLALITADVGGFIFSGHPIPWLEANQGTMIDVVPGLGVACVVNDRKPAAQLKL